MGMTHAVFEWLAWRHRDHLVMSRIKLRGLYRHSPKTLGFACVRGTLDVRPHRGIAAEVAMRDIVASVSRRLSFDVMPDSFAEDCRPAAAMLSLNEMRDEVNNLCESSEWWRLAVLRSRALWPDARETIVFLTTGVDPASLSKMDFPIMPSTDDGAIAGFPVTPASVMGKHWGEWA